MQQGDETSANQKMFILQDTHNDATGSLLVYATIDSLALDLIMNERDSSCVAVLPSGVAIVPDCCKKNWGANDISGSGSLVTFGYQVSVNSSPTAKFPMKSAKAFNNLISRKIHDIETALSTASDIPKRR